MGTSTVVTGLVAALALAGCGSSDRAPGGADRADAAPTTTTTTTTTATATATATSEDPAGARSSRPSERVGGSDRRAAQRALDAAVDVMVREPVTAVRVDTYVGRTSAVVTEGVAVAGGGWRASSRFDDPSTPARWDHRMKVLSTGKSLWMQVDWRDERAGCWLALGASEVPLGIQAMRTEEPAYVSLLGYLRATGFANPTRTAFHGLLAVNAALSLLTAPVVEQVEADQAVLKGATVPVQMGYDGRRVSGIGLTGSDLVAALEDAGAQVGKQARTALEHMLVTVNYPPAGRAPAPVTAPPADLQFTVGSPGCR